MSDDPYDKLKGTATIDWDQVDQYASLLDHMDSVVAEYKKLDHIKDQNRELEPYLWTTATGIRIPLNKLTDSHLNNIVKKYLRRESCYVPSEIFDEFNQRGLNRYPTQAATDIDSTLADADEDTFELDDDPRVDRDVDDREPGF